MKFEVGDLVSVVGTPYKALKVIKRGDMISRGSEALGPALQYLCEADGKRNWYHAEDLKLFKKETA